MPRHIHHRSVGDTLTPLGVTLSLNGEAVNLTGRIVKFKMVANDGTVTVAETTTGITVTGATTGEVQYDFQAADVDTAGTFFAWFTVYSGSEKDTYPADGRELQIEIHATE
jgi:hypothetical protein